MRRRWFSLRAVLLHIVAVVAVGACLFLAFWQYRRATGGNGLSWAYVFEWPFFAAVVVYGWWDLIHFPQPEEPRGDPADVLPPGWFRAKARGQLSRPSPALDRRRPGALGVGGHARPRDELDGTQDGFVDAGIGNGGSWLEVDGTEVLPPSPGDELDPIDLEEAERREAYNRYLAQLNASEKRKRW